jgi:hypothetical protein
MDRIAPKPSTIKALFAKSGNECSFSGCAQVLVDERNLFVGEVCHINAVKSTESRFDPAKSADELRAYDNLILLCHPHHVRVDALPAEYTAQGLIAMRQQHEKAVEHKIYKVSDDIIDDALFQFLESDWEPYLEPTINHLIEDMDAGRIGQQGLNWRSAQISELLDAKLYALTLKAISKASLAERRTLVREHFEWDEYRRKASHEASLEMEGGTGAPLLYHATYNDITEVRIATLATLV